MKSSRELSIRSCKGRISGFQSLGTVDGPGVRSVVFGVGCPLRCVYCHNPETWSEPGEETTAGELADRILRFRPYTVRGGVTFGGGEPLAQAKFFSALARLLKAEGMHIAIDTSANVVGADADELISLVDLAIVDVKFASEAEYKKYTGGSLEPVKDFLGKLARLGKRAWVRQVIVPGLNDTESDVMRLCDVIGPYKEIIDRVELLPFRKLCLEKYERLGIPFPLASVPEADGKAVEKLNGLVAFGRISSDFAE